MDYINDVKINRYHLDDELERQPQLISEYSELLVEAEKKYDDQKEKIKYLNETLDEKRAEYDLKIRAGEIELSKITEKAIESKLNVIPILIRRKAELHEERIILNEYKSKMNSLKGVLDSLSNKKMSLNNLTSLTLNNYYSQVADNKIKQQRDKLNNKNNNKRSNV